LAIIQIWSRALGVFGDYAVANGLFTPLVECIVENWAELKKETNS
jgi:hypothetical protein